MDVCGGEKGGGGGEEEDLSDWVDFLVKMSLASMGRAHVLVA